jgi:hypothetical protein
MGSPGKASASTEEASPGAGGTALLLALLVALLYGRHLGEGLLADDFLYVRWARQGWDVLLRHVTVASTPQMIRPLPGLLWELTRSPAGPLALHALSLLLHLGNGLLLAAFLRRRGVGGPAALAVAALFLAFPLSTEPVIWASASFDLWACLFALAALVVVARGEENLPVGRAALAAGLFLLALLCKESVLPLPFLLPLLLPWRQVRRAVLAMVLVGAAYLLFRFALFRGPGGYLGDHGTSLLFRLKLLPTLRSVFLRLPFRVVVPVKRPGALAPLFALLSALLLGGILAPWLRLRALLAAAVGMGLALLPVLPIFSLGVDQEGSRMIYFPAAVGLLLLAGAARGPGVPRLPWASRFALAGLLLYWSAATLWNGRAWTAAAAEVSRTRTALAELAPRLPPRSQVAVTGHDSWQGAFAWRNGLTAAAEVDGLPGGHLWTLGTAAVVEDPGPWLGRSLFEVRLGPGGELLDRTACARALLPAPGSPPPSLAGWRVAAGPEPGGDAVTEVVLPAAPLVPPAGDLAVRLELGACRPRAAISGTLFWLFADSRKFEATDSLPFTVGPRTAPEVVIHLFPPFPKTRPRERITLLLDLPRELAPCVVGARIVAAPPICGP